MRTLTLMAGMLATIATLGAPAGVGAASRLHIVNTMAGGRVEVRAGTRTEQTAPILADTGSAFTPRVSAPISVSYTGFSTAAKAAFQAAVNVWKTKVSSPRTIHIKATWKPLGSGVLGSAGPEAFYLLSDDKVYPAALAEAVCACDGSAPVEIGADFNSTFPSWYLGTDGNAPSSRYDFMSVVLHELGHGLGFLSSFYVSGSIGGWGFDDGTRSYPLRFDTKMYTSGTSTVKLKAASVYPNPSSALKAQMTDGSVYFGGTEVTTLLGHRAKLYAPSPWQGGSSLSHFDENAYPTGTTNALMTPYLDNGEVLHQPGPLTLAVLRDIGWTTA